MVMRWMERVGPILGVCVCWAGVSVPAWAQRPADPPRASRVRPMVNRPTKADNLTFRPTVKLRKGNACGTGSLIASVPGETLILTAAHVVEGPGELIVEFHRYNVGAEVNQPSAGWPKKVPAQVIQADAEADVALVIVSGLARLPFLALPLDTQVEVKAGEHVISVGIDKGEKLQSWEARVKGQVDLNRGDGKTRPFLVTDKAPQHGRSGGGLFRDDGRLIGVCVGRVDMQGNSAVGIFASTESIRRLLNTPRALEAVSRFPTLTRAVTPADSAR